jgi:hypothetical protein
MKNEGAENFNINRPNHRSSRHHGDIGMSTELQHVRGTINNDEYAVINRNTLQHQYHPPTNTVINREIVYITPTPEYNRLMQTLYNLIMGFMIETPKHTLDIIFLCSMYVSQNCCG